MSSQDGGQAPDIISPWTSSSEINLNWNQRKKQRKNKEKNRRKKMKSKENFKKIRKKNKEEMCSVEVE